MNELTVQKYQPPSEIMNVESSAMSIEGLTRQVALIQNVMDKVMKVDEHYGVIPGTNKPTLLKPGAEKLCLTFRLDPQYEILREIRDKDFIAYTVKCDLYHIPTQNHIASGVGSCNTRESKYRYRSENTGRPVPKEYWDSRDSKTLGGSQYKPRKKDGKWVIYEQVENENPWDLDNTIIKMACKRALVAATLNATAASDIFTQDVEDMPPEIINGNKPQQKPVESKKGVQESFPQEESKAADDDAATGPQYKKLYALGFETWPDQPESEVRNRVRAIGTWFRLGDQLTKKEASGLIENWYAAIEQYMESQATIPEY